MELFALDKDFQNISQIVPTNIQWTRKYYEHGTFSIQLPYDQYSTEMKYVYTEDRKEVGMINKVSYNDDSNSKSIQIEGYFLERWLNDKIVYPTFYGTGEITQTLTKMFNQYKEDIRINSVNAKNTGNKIDFQATGDELGKKINEILQTQEMSYRVLYDYVRNTFTLEFYKGLDRTQSQIENNSVTFSTLWNNIKSVNADTDDSNFKNYAIVAGTGQADERITVDVDISNGAYKKKLFVDARNEKYNSSEQTLEQYKLELRQKGLEKLLNHKSVTNIVFDPLGNSYDYLIDYDLGDKCDIIISDIGISIEARIIAIYEVFKNNIHTIELEFGDKILTRIDKLERSLIV